MGSPLARNVGSLIPLAVLAMGLACGRGEEPSGALPTTPTPTVHAVQVEVVAKGLEVPWALAFAPDGRLFLTERPGRIRVIDGGALQPEPVATLDVARTGEAGLLGLALDPGFQENHYIYIYYTYLRDGSLTNRVVRLTEKNGHASEPLVLLDGIPGAGIHDGGRLKFGPDGKLYITTGDAANSSLAQRLDSLGGKVLRINSDGSIPGDNPFPGSPIYSFGHRNPQGLAWHPQSGLLFATEHGPSGHDELNIIRPGGNYGWPEVSGQDAQSRFISPVVESGSLTWAPAGAAVWEGSLFFATLRGQHLHRVVLEGTTGEMVAHQETLLGGQFDRLRDVVQGPDGLLYIATSNRDGRGSPGGDDDKVLRLAPTVN